MGQHHHNKPNLTQQLLAQVQACATNLHEIKQQLARIAEALQHKAKAQIPTYLTLVRKGQLEQD